MEQIHWKQYTGTRAGNPWLQSIDAEMLLDGGKIIFKKKGESQVAVTYDRSYVLAYIYATVVKPLGSPPWAILQKLVSESRNGEQS